MGAMPQWREPLRELQNGMEKAARDDLDFSISYDSEDELGRLCRSMERMRRELCRSQERTWELLQQRRLLNASVAHDLRTPVTVLKGYLDYLKEDGCDKKVSDEDIRTAVCGMDEAVKRLERYAGCVQDIDRLENDWMEAALQYDYFGNKWIDWQVLADQIPYRFHSPDSFLESSRNFETTNNGSTYIFHISEYLPSGSVQPYEFAAAAITEVLEQSKISTYEKALVSSLVKKAVKDGRLVGAPEDSYEK